jgi:hypothetical protein
MFLFTLIIYLKMLIAYWLVWLCRWPKGYHVLNWFFLPKPGFWNLFEFSAALKNQYLPHSGSKSYQINSISSIRFPSWQTSSSSISRGNLLTHFVKTQHFCLAHLSMKEGSLFCFVLELWDHRTGMLQIVFLVSLESSRRRRGAWAWFHDSSGLAVQKFLNIEWFLHWKLN